MPGRNASSGSISRLRPRFTDRAPRHCQPKAASFQILIETPTIRKRCNLHKTKTRGNF